MKVIYDLGIVTILLLNGWAKFQNSFSKYFGIVFPKLFNRGVVKAFLDFRPLKRCMEYLEFKLPQPKQVTVFQIVVSLPNHIIFRDGKRFTLVKTVAYTLLATKLKL